MSDTAIQENKSLSLIKEISIETVKTVIEKCQSSVEKATAAASLLIGKPITSDEQDAEVEKMMVKVRNTYEDREVDRTSVTGPMNAFIKEMIAINKAISTDKSVKESVFVQLAEMRNTWANEKYQKAEAEKRRIAAEQRTKEIAAELSGYFAQKKSAVINNALTAARSALSDYRNGITLDNYEAKLASLKYTPKIKQEVYDSIFNYSHEVANNRLRITEPEFIAFKQSMDLTGLLYEDVNGEYAPQATNMLEDFMANLPAHKVELERIAELAKTDAAEAAAQRERVQKENDERDAAARKKQEDDAAAEQKKIAEQTSHQVLEANFDATVGVQEVQDVKGTVVRKAILSPDFKPEDVVNIFGEVLFHVMLTGKFDLWKRDKAKNVKEDADGDKIMCDELQGLLDFFAKHCDVEIAGIAIKQKINTSARTKPVF